MPTLEARWYWGEFTEWDEDAAEPDWSRVPEEKREIVRRIWQERVAEVSRWKVWGPQVEMYQSGKPPYHNVRVTVLGPVEERRP